MQFTYGGTTYTINGKHTLNQERAGKVIRFRAETLVTGNDAAITAAVDNLSTSFQNFSVASTAGNRIDITHGSDGWIVRSSCTKAGDRKDTGKSAVLTVEVLVIRAGAKLTYGGTAYYTLEGHSLSAKNGGKDVTFEGVILMEDAASYATAVAALSTDYQDVVVQDPDAASTFHTATNGATWVNRAMAMKSGEDNDESYALKVTIRSESAGYRIQYNSATYRIDNGHTLGASDADGGIVFSCTISDLTAAEYATAISTLSINEKDFVLEDISAATQVYSVTHSTMTGGVNTKASVDTIEANGDGAAKIRFVLRAQRPPALSGRNGRRTANIDIATGADNLRTVTLRGQYVGNATGTAKETYDAQVATWVASVLADIDGSATWQQRDTPTVDYDDNDGVLSFTTVRQEIWWPGATPNEVSNGIHRSMTITILDPLSMGDAELAGITFDDGVGRVRVDTVTDYTAAPSSTADLLTYWFSTLRPWILAAVQAFTRETAWIFAGPSLTLRGVDRRRLLTSQELISYSATRNYLVCDEQVSKPGRSGIMHDKIWSGLEHDYDKRTEGPTLELEHRLRLERIEQEPETPPLLDGDWDLIEDTPSEATQWDDPKGVSYRRKRYIYQWVRRYRYAPVQTGVTLITPQPLGEPIF